MLTGGDWLTNLNLIVAVEARFNFKLNNGEIDESENVGDLVQIIGGAIASLMMNLVSRAISICQNDHPAGSGFPHDGGNSASVAEPYRACAAREAIIIGLRCTAWAGGVPHST